MLARRGSASRPPPPMTGVTEYPVIWLPPPSLVAVQDTLADFMLAVAVTLIGTPGAACLCESLIPSELNRRFLNTERARIPNTEETRHPAGLSSLVPVRSSAVARRLWWQCC